MNLIISVGLFLVAVILLVGIIRVIFAPWNGFVNFLMEIMLLDWLGDGLFYILGLIFNGDDLDW